MTNSVINVSEGCTCYFMNNENVYFNELEVVWWFTCEHLHSCLYEGNNVDLFVFHCILTHGETMRGNVERGRE